MYLIHKQYVDGAHLSLDSTILTMPLSFSIREDYRLIERGVNMYI